MRSERRSRETTLAEALAALREGRSRFEQFAREVGPAFRRLAGYFLGRWPGQRTVGEEDLVQEMLVAAWRAVLNWDPERRSKKGRQVLLAAEYGKAAALRRAAHK